MTPQHSCAAGEPWPPGAVSDDPRCPGMAGRWGAREEPSLPGAPAATAAPAPPG